MVSVLRLLEDLTQLELQLAVVAIEAVKWFVLPEWKRVGDNKARQIAPLALAHEAAVERFRDRTLLSGVGEPDENELLAPIAVLVCKLGCHIAAVVAAVAVVVVVGREDGEPRRLGVNAADGAGLLPKALDVGARGKPHVALAAQHASEESAVLAQRANAHHELAVGARMRWRVGNRLGRQRRQSVHVARVRVVLLLLALHARCLLSSRSCAVALLAGAVAAARAAVLAALALLLAVAVAAVAVVARRRFLVVGLVVAAVAFVTVVVVVVIVTVRSLLPVGVQDEVFALQTWKCQAGKTLPTSAPQGRWRLKIAKA